MTEHYGKIFSSVLTAVILALVYGFSGFIVASVEARAEDWVVQRMDKRIIEQNAQLSKEYKELKIQQNGARNQIGVINGQLRSINSTLNSILSHITTGGTVRNATDN